jgi:hypothetical protein
MELVMVTRVAEAAITVIDKLAEMAEDRLKLVNQMVVELDYKAVLLELTIVGQPVVEVLGIMVMVQDLLV